MKKIDQHIEKVVLFVAALVLLGSAVFVGMGASGFKERPEFLEIQPILGGSASRNDTVKPLDTEKLERANVAFAEPAQWAVSPLLLFKAANHILKREDGNEQLIKISEDINIHEPINNEWIMKYDLAIDDSNLKNRDFDGDGFTVLEEFLAKTNPTDATSRPPLWVKLRTKDYVEIPFRIKFSSRSGETVFIETLDIPNSVTQFLRMGDDIEGTNFRIKDLSVKEEKHPDLDFMRDASEVIFEEKTTGKLITARVETIANDPDSYIVLTSLLDDKTFKLKKDDEFALPQEEAVKYKVIDMSRNRTVIQNTVNGEKHEIPRADQ